jgi:hypothetical protein
MKSPKPKGSGSISKPATAPAKRKRGQPPRTVPRICTLPRVSEATHAIFAAYSRQNPGVFIADAIEAAALLLNQQIDPKKPV